jgi:hypothetical protein
LAPRLHKELKRRRRRNKTSIFSSNSKLLKLVALGGFWQFWADFHVLGVAERMLKLGSNL